MDRKSTSLRWMAVGGIALMGLVILLGVTQRTTEMTNYQRYYDSSVIGSVDDVQKRMGPIVAGLHGIKKKEEKKHKRKSKKNKDIPDPKDLTNTKTVWDFLYDHTDNELIMDTGSKEEEAELDDYDLNIITLLIKKVEKERADEWLVQLAIWFHSVAVHWPRGMELSEDAISTIESFLEYDFGAMDSISDTVLSDMVQTNASMESLRAHGGSKKTVQPGLNETELLEQVPSVMLALLKDGDISGKVVHQKIKSAIRDNLTLQEWMRLLTFIVCVAEATPMFDSYLELWKQTTFHQVEDVVFEVNPVKKEEMMQTSAQLLSVLERGCEDFPRTSRLIRAMFLKELNDEEAAEKKAEKAGKSKNWDAP